MLGTVPPAAFTCVPLLLQVLWPKWKHTSLSNLTYLPYLQPSAGIYLVYFLKLPSEACLPTTDAIHPATTHVRIILYRHNSIGLCTVLVSIRAIKLVVSIWILQSKAQPRPILPISYITLLYNLHWAPAPLLVSVSWSPQTLWVSGSTSMASRMGKLPLYPVYVPLTQVKVP